MDAAASWLVTPISEDEPCGESLEDTQLLASFDAYHIFGQITPLTGDIDWREMRSNAEEALHKSKDFRLLAHLALARLHVDGLLPFCDLLSVAAAWLETYPENVYPLIDDDAILRRSALNNFSDRMAAVDALRRAHFIRNPAIGAFSLRDLEIARGQLTPASAEGEAPTESQIVGAIAAASDEELASTAERLAAAIDALKKIDSLMRDKGGSEAAPDTDALLTPISRIHALFSEQMTVRAANAAATEAAGAGGGAAGEPGAAAVIGVGSIRTRDDAVRALDAVAEFFRKNEPSSPLPLVVERAKRLIGKDFLEVLADMAPDGLDQAKRIGGVRDE